LASQYFLQKSAPMYDAQIYLICSDYVSRGNSIPANNPRITPITPPWTLPFARVRFSHACNECQCEFVPTEFPIFPSIYTNRAHISLFIIIHYIHIFQTFTLVLRWGSSSSCLIYPMRSAGVCGLRHWLRICHEDLLELDHRFRCDDQPHGTEVALKDRIFCRPH